jgi:hypothetical protein
MTATDQLEPKPGDTEDCLPGVTPPAVAPEPIRPIPVPTRTVPLFLVLFAVGLLPFLFAYRTVHRRDLSDLMANSNAGRSHDAISHWLDHGYFNSRGLICWTVPGKPFTIYRSSTGGLLISGFLVEKVYSAITGHYSWKLLALHNQLLTLLTATLLGLLGFRMATRIGATPLHALALGIAVEIVHFTFPDSLSLYWEMSGRECWLLFATIFLLLEERACPSRTRALTIAQGAAAFFLTYMEYIAGTAFLFAYIVIKLILGTDRAQVKRLAATCLAPALLALAVYSGQLKAASMTYPDHPTYAGTFMNRSGLDGSSQYYVDHLDIAYGRSVARLNFPENNRANLFRWEWLFFAGASSILVVLYARMRDRVSRFEVTVLTSLLGAYLLYAAFFSQAVMIHPYLYDVMLFTPLILALFAVVPALLESHTGHRGVAVLVAVFLAIWVSMVQLRHYALRYPVPEKRVTGATTADASKVRYCPCTSFSPGGSPL